MTPLFEQGLFGFVSNSHLMVSLEQDFEGVLFCFAFLKPT